MSEARRNPTGLPVGKDDEGTQLGLLLDSARAMMDEEFQRAERIENKSRNQFTVIGAYFAVVMATTAGVLNVLVANHQKLQAWVPPSVGGTALASTIAIFVAGGYSFRAWRTRKQDALDASTIRDYVPWAERGNVAVVKQLIEAFTGILDDRRAQNASRVKDLKCAGKACLAAGIVATIQLR
jgi:hypothetical protein